MAKKLGFVRTFVYVMACMMTFGMLWVFKIAVQKAIIDANK